MKIPDRWIDYKTVGDVIDGTRFINFKVPLKESALKANLPKAEWLTTTSLVHDIKEKGYKLGLVIDLTNTNKYYNKKDFEKEGIQYEKIFTEGHKVPSRMVQDRFKEVVTNFLESNSDNDYVIGVHCTHGLNRTGYLVCRYLIDNLDFEPNAAIEAFNKGRGHMIERQNYLADLRGQSSKGGEEEHNLTREPPKNYSRGRNVRRFDSRCDERTSYGNVHTSYDDDYKGFGRSYNNDQQQSPHNYHNNHRHPYANAGSSSASSDFSRGYRPSASAHNGNQLSRQAMRSGWTSNSYQEPYHISQEGRRAGWTSNSYQEPYHISQEGRRAGWSSRGSLDKSFVSSSAGRTGQTHRKTVRNEQSPREDHHHRRSKDRRLHLQQTHAI